MISVAGLVLLGLWIFNYLSYGYKGSLIKNLSFLFFISINVQYGFFIDTDLIVIQYWQIALILGLFSIFPYLPNKKTFSATSIIILFILFLLVKLLFFPLQENVVIGFEKSYEAALGNLNYFEPPILSKFTIFISGFAIINVLIASVIHNQVTPKEQAEIVSNYSRYIRYYFNFLIIEVLIKYAGFSDNYYEFIKTIFGFTGSNMENHLRNGFPMIHGLMREGSHFAYSASFGILMLYADLKVNNSEKSLIYIFIGFFLLFISMSFSVAVMGLVLIMMWVISNGFIKSSIIFLLSCILILAIHFSNFSTDFSYYYLSRLDDFYDDLNLINYYLPFEDTFVVLSSGMSRMAAIYNNIYLLKYAPLFGTGIATNSSHSSLSLLASETGIIGTLIFFIYFIRPFVPTFGKSLFYLMIFIWFFAVFFIPIAQPNMIVRIDFIMVPMVISLLINAKLVKKYSK